MGWLGDFLHWLDPAWITAGVAVLVGGYTIRNVQTARRAYVEGVEVRKVAAARLVWAQVTKMITLEKDAEIPRTLSFDTSSVWNNHHTIHEDGEGRRDRVNQRSVVLLVEITNHSDEPMGNLSLTVRDASGNDLQKPGFRYTVLAPKATVTVCVVLALAVSPRTVWSTHFVTLHFRDSAGHTWKREGTEPPTSADFSNEAALRHPVKALHASFTRKATQ